MCIDTQATLDDSPSGATCVATLGDTVPNRAGRPRPYGTKAQAWLTFLALSGRNVYRYAGGPR